MINKVWLIGDFSQAEARVVAWRGPIPAMKKWFSDPREDIHLNVAKLIGKVVEDNKLDMPINATTGNKLWNRMAWQELTKKNSKDDERQIAKNCVHANNYEVGKGKFAQMTGLPVKYAATLQDIYHGIFPEIRGGYHKWIKDCLAHNRTIWNPLGWKRSFYGNYLLDRENINRAAYAWYAQSTIGLKNIRSLVKLCEVNHNWPWPIQLYNKNTSQLYYSPHTVLNMGYDVQLQIHDSIGMAIENDPLLICEASLAMKKIMETPIMIEGEELIVPVDFQIGPSWGELTTYDPLAA